MSIASDGTLTALIADDEPLLRASLRSELEKIWPSLDVTIEVSDGVQALKQLQESNLTIAFLDIKMPGMSGLEVARELLKSWPSPSVAKVTGWPPLLVLVSAYGEFALEAFEGAAIDYVLKPVTADRLSVTVARLQARLRERVSANARFDHLALEALVQKLARLSGDQLVSPNSTGSTYLKVIRAAVGDAVRMIPVEQVILFEASDKYVVVHTAEGESLIRESLRELLSQLDPARFQQVHRSSIVNMRTVKCATRNACGKLVLSLAGISEQPVVSRHHAHLFKAM